MADGSTPGDINASDDFTSRVHRSSQGCHRPARPLTSPDDEDSSPPGRDAAQVPTQQETNRYQGGDVCQAEGEDHHPAHEVQLQDEDQQDELHHADANSGANGARHPRRWRRHRRLIGSANHQDAHPQWGNQRQEREVRQECRCRILNP
jgi:hypothetical protein